MKHMEIDVETTNKLEIIDITPRVRELIEDRRLLNGMIVVYVPHTTAGIAINENADRDVKSDFLRKMGEIVPPDDNYRHIEGNSDAHIKTIITNTSQMVFVENGRLLLGTWQGLYFCEYDGPRNRKCWIKFLEE